MATLSLACIVEGKGEVTALPILLRRFVPTVSPDVYATVQHLARKSRDILLKQGGFEVTLEIAIRKLPMPGAVLVLLDSDKDCPKELAPALMARAAHTAAGRCAVAVILAKCEFENWFIAAAESIAGHAGLPPGLVAPANPESIRGAKEWLREHMVPGRTYSPTINQPALAATFDLNLARQRAPSFDKFCREVRRLCDHAASHSR
jgi:hypothetical protein